MKELRRIFDMTSDVVTSRYRVLKGSDPDHFLSQLMLNFGACQIPVVYFNSGVAVELEWLSPRLTRLVVDIS